MKGRITLTKEQSYTDEHGKVITLKAGEHVVPWEVTVKLGIPTGHVTAVPDPDPAPWADYDDMTVAEITERMATLGDTERNAVLAYEAANRKRKGVLEYV